MPVFSQNTQIKVGFGNYEGFNLGLCHNYKKWKLEYGLGNDLNIYQQGYCSSGHISAGMRIFNKYVSENQKVYAQFKTLVWNLENESNIFSVVSLSPELLYRYRINQKYQLGVYGGVVWSSVFRYKRKGFEEIGFPKEWQPGFGISLYYSLK